MNTWQQTVTIGSNCGVAECFHEKSSWSAKAERLLERSNCFRIQRYIRTYRYFVNNIEVSKLAWLEIKGMSTYLLYVTFNNLCCVVDFDFIDICCGSLGDFI